MKDGPGEYQRDGKGKIERRKRNLRNPLGKSGELTYRADKHRPRIRGAKTHLHYERSREDEVSLHGRMLICSVGRVRSSLSEKSLFDSINRVGLLQVLGVRAQASGVR